MSGQIEFNDESGKPRSMEDIKAAFDAIQKEVITNHLAKFKDGFPAVIHYIVVLDALRELMTLRELISKLRQKKMEDVL